VVLVLGGVVAFAVSCALARPAAAGAQRSASVDAGSGKVSLSGSHTGSGGGGGGHKSSGGSGGGGSGGSGSSGASAKDEVVLPDPEVAVTPVHRGVVGAEAVFTVAVPAVRDPEIPTPEGTDVVRLRVHSLRVDFGDGRSESVPVDKDDGRTPLRRDVHHTYERPCACRVRVVVVWSALYVPAAGPPEELGPVETDTSRAYPVVEVRTALVE